jgi:DNA gyrase subunit A
LVFTNFARVFRLPINKLKESEVRDRGESLGERLLFEPDEHITTILPDQASGYVSLVSQTGTVRCLRHHLFGEYLKPGTSLLNIKETGPLAAACWTPGDADLFIATQNGIAIRFAEKLIPPRGEIGIRPSAGDVVTSITSVNDNSLVFLLSSDGKGTLRAMSGFNPNKSPGGSGKNALKTSKLAAAFAVDLSDDIFILAKSGKLIRFSAEDVPQTEGVVQGAICINLRMDKATTAIRSIPQKSR